MQCASVHDRSQRSEARRCSSARFMSVAESLRQATVSGRGLKGVDEFPAVPFLGWLHSRSARLRYTIWSASCRSRLKRNDWIRVKGKPLPISVSHSRGLRRTLRGFVVGMPSVQNRAASRVRFQRPGHRRYGEFPSSLYSANLRRPKTLGCLKSVREAEQAFEFQVVICFV